MDIPIGQSFLWLTFQVLKADGTPYTGLGASGFICRYLKAAGTAFDTLVLVESGLLQNFREISDGIYTIKFTAAEFDTAGPFFVLLTDNSLPDTFRTIREDNIVVPDALPVGETVLLEFVDQVAAPLDGVYISIYDTTDTNLLTVTQADISGEATVYLPVGNYKLHLVKPLVTFTMPESIDVPLGGDTFVLEGERLTIPVPPAPDLCVFYGVILAPTGTPIEDTDIVLRSTKRGIDAILDDNGISVQEVTDATDEFGAFSINLIRGATVRCTIPAIELDVSFVVPDQASYGLHEL